MASIGTVRTPQMKEQTIYVSDDGEQFDNAADCQLWERLAEKVETGRNNDPSSSGEFRPKRTMTLKASRHWSAQNFLDIRLHEEI